MKPGEIFNPWKLFTGIFIPNSLVRFPGLSPGAKMLYGRLAQYAGKDGTCFPAQDTLAYELGIGRRQVIRLLKELEDLKFIQVEKPSGLQKLKHSTNRYAFLWHDIFSTSGSDINVTSGHDVNVTSYKGTEENQKEQEIHKESKARTKKPFSPPSLTDIQAYCLERKNQIDPQRFLSYYESNGWRVGKNPMKDWKAAIRNWESRNGDYDGANRKVSDHEPDSRFTKAGGIRPGPGEFEGRKPLMVIGD